MQIDGYRDLLLGHYLLQPAGIHGVGADSAAPGQADVLIIDIREQLRLTGESRTGRGHDPAPVGIPSVKSGPYQRRIRYSPRHQRGFIIICRPRYFELDYFCRALAVGHHFKRQPLADRRQGFPKQPGVVAILIDGHATLAACQQKDTVVGAHVAVHGHGIERSLDRLLQQILKQAGRNVGIRSHERKHGGHIGSNHARTLGAGAHTHDAAGKRHLDGAVLVDLVGSADSLSEIAAAEIGHRLRGGRDPGFDQLHGKRHADDAGRCHRQMPGVYSRRGRGQLHHRPCVFEPPRTGTGVGRAAVDHNALQ